MSLHEDKALHLQVTLADPRDRLDKLVVHRLLQAGQPASRATVQRWIDAGRVLVNGVAARASMLVPVGARVDIQPDDPPPLDAKPDPAVHVPVVFEDDHLMIIDKPAGLVVHPARGHLVGTLVNGLLALPGFQSSVSQDDHTDPTTSIRPGIVHRLDKGTSGLLVVAKNESTREALKHLFARHLIEREYIAIVLGKAQDATYDTPHGRHPTDRLRFTSRLRTQTSHQGKIRRAITHVRVLEHLGNEASLVSCTLDTGRTHQIRIHLLEQSKTPILADPLYGRTPGRAEVRTIAHQLDRQALHARVLGFVHPQTKVLMRWESPLPDELNKALQQLRDLATKLSTYGALVT